MSHRHVSSDALLLCRHPLCQGPAQHRRRRSRGKGHGGIRKTKNALRSPPLCFFFHHHQRLNAFAMDAQDALRSSGSSEEREKKECSCLCPATTDQLSHHDGQFYFNSEVSFNLKTSANRLVDFCPYV
ncbi:hypothetical protein CDAR_100841 [Caerostris darwini]|uniref:Uncharacterized protein n=1 Tax=Caerostris darwini TaxID=1538125 RepID=A0AAV4VW57_9ARAC|nr:hypothetical protein CDAR_100841 [Caerostris darwini]